MLRACLVVALLGGCWNATPAAPAAATPAAATQLPALCPEQRLRDFATKIDAGIESLRVAPTGRQADVLEVKCPLGSTDDACVAHARANAVIAEGWEVTGIEIDNNGDIVGYEVELEVDGVREVGVYPNVAKGVERAKELQAQGKRVTVLRGDAKNAGGDRVARIDLFGPPGPVQRVAKIHKMPDGERAAQLEAIHAAAKELDVTILTVAAGPKTIELMVGCDE